jgi:hypothetical protein
MPKWEGGTGPLPILLCVVVAGNASKVHNNIAITWNLDKFHYTYANQNINHFFPLKRVLKDNSVILAPLPPARRAYASESGLPRPVPGRDGGG